MKLKSLIYSFSAVLIALMAGCAENPEAKSAKQAREITATAFKAVQDYKLDVGYDYQQAKEQVDKALSYAASAGGKADGAYFASADLADAYVTKNSVSLSDWQEAIAAKFADCSAALAKTESIQSRITEVEMLMNNGNNEAVELEKVLGNSQEGMKARLDAAKKEYSQLKTKLDGYKSAAEEASKKSKSIRTQADKMLREAQLLSGEQRIALERQAYGLLKGDDGKSVFHYDSLVQNNLDLAESIQTQINTVKPLIDKLEAEITQLASRIDELKNQDQTLGYSQHIAALNEQYEKSKTALKDAVEEFNKELQAYNEDISEKIQLYESIRQNYAKVRSKGLAEYAKLKSSETAAKIASLNSRSYAFLKRLHANALNIKQEQSDILNDITSSTSELTANYLQAAEDAYAVATEEFEALLDTYSSGDFADTAARKFMSTIYSKLNFDKLTNNYEQTKTQLLAKIEDIKDISIQADPKFANSKVAALFADYGIEFKTAEQKLEEKYLDFRVELSSAQNLTGNAKEEKLLDLIERFSMMQKPQNEQFYEEQIKYAYDLFRDDWIAIYENQQQQLGSLELFSQYLAADTQPEEIVTEPDQSDPNSPF